MYLSSFQIANVPMTPAIPAGPPVTTFSVTSPLPIPPTATDLLTFAQHYPTGGTWSAFANFLHNGAGYDISIDGRAYALPFDDQGGFSSDLNAATSVANPASISITLGPWTPKTSSAQWVGDDLVVTGTQRADTILILPVWSGLAGGVSRVQVLMNGRSLGTFATTSRIVIHGLAGNDVINAAGVRNAVTVYGGAGNDVIFGGLNDDVLNGGAGDDYLFDLLGRDQLISGQKTKRAIRA
jgi:Ca2+-binding RTX toxin-like protein